MQISKFPVWVCALALCGGVALHAQDNAAQAAARAALLQKMNELDANPSAAMTPAPAPAPAPTPAPVPAQPTAVPVVAAPAAPVVEITPTPAIVSPAAVASPAPAVDTAAQTATRAALLQKMNDLGGTSAPAPQPSATVSAPPVKTAPAQPDVAPAPPIAASKEQKLAWLLGLYKSNQLTPQQYHEQRAAILAEP